jgi:FkbM family methyltransferase
MKKGILELCSRLGYSVVAEWRMEHLATSTYMRKLFALLDIDCVLDVGANRGQYRDFLRKHVGYSGHIVSFEPIPENLEILRARAKEDAYWSIEGCALGKSSGHATFNVMVSSTFSSFLQPDHTSTSRFKDGNNVAASLTVNLKRLDEVLPQVEKKLPVKNIYLKLDTQGFDLEVAAGGAQNMHRFKALQTEASVVPIYKGAPDYVTSIRTFQSMGFVLSGMFPNNPCHFPRLFEFDCFMINRKFAGDGNDRRESSGDELKSEWESESAAAH